MLDLMDFDRSAPASPPLYPAMSNAPVPLAAPVGDYEIVRRAIEMISVNYRDQPSLEEVAGAIGLEGPALERVFRRWSGLTPKAFLQAITLDHARRILGEGASLLDAAFEVGFSGPSRLHDLFVKHEALSPGIFKAKGEGAILAYGFADTPFGRAVLVSADKGLAGVGFCDAGEGGDEAAMADMRRRWPQAAFVPQSAERTARLAARVFSPEAWNGADRLRIVLIGTDFEIRVWEALLKIPLGTASTYGTLAEKIGCPKAARAVGAAIGRNPISFVVPCHRVLGSGGALTGYHWGVTRKRAMLGWEAGLLARD